MREKLGNLGQKIRDLAAKAAVWIRNRGKPRRGTVILLWVNVGLLVGMVAAVVLLGRITGLQASQQAAARWANGLEDARYAQVSIFFAEGAGLDYSAIAKIREGMENKLRENSIDTRSDNARLWLEAYSATQSVSVGRASSGGSLSVQMTGVGGDYFYIHPEKLLYGEHLQRDGLSKDTVVIDELLAWKLYGASNVVGFDIEINGVPCLVSGVVEAPGWPESKTYGDDCRLYAAFELMEKLGGGTAMANCYELVLPSPVSGFGFKMAEEVIAPSETQSMVVENSARYGTLTLLKKLRDFSTLGMQTKAVALPYWENAARGVESYAVLLMAVILALGVCPLVCLIVVLVRCWRQRGKLWRWMVETYRRRRLERWQKKREQKAQDIESVDSKEEVLL